MPSGTGLNLLEEALPDQFFDVGIAEEHAVLFAADGYLRISSGLCDLAPLSCSELLTRLFTM